MGVTMETKPLYWDDPEIHRFEARIIHRQVRGDRWQWILDQTAFYPGGGGQGSDTGSLFGRPLLGIAKEGDEIIHEIRYEKGDPDPPDTVVGEVDAVTRRDSRQQHTGQHLLSAALLEIAGLETVSVHLGERYCAVETEGGEPTKAQIDAVVDRVDTWIGEDRTVRALFHEADEADDLKLRRPLKTAGRVRIVEIDGVDRTGCGGIHVSRTGDVRLILPDGVEKIRGRYRTRWTIGDRAIQRARRDTRMVDTFSRLLSTTPRELPDRIAEIHRDNGVWKRRVAQLEAESAVREMEDRIAAISPDSRGTRVLVADIEGGTARLGACLRSLQGKNNLRVFLWSREKGDLRWVIYDGTGAFDFEGFASRHLRPTGGRGGGKVGVWQGSLPNDADPKKLAEAFLSMGG